jgi:fucose 4-O-acetylase-like acetyltransferase
MSRKNKVSLANAFNLRLLQESRYNWVDYLRGVIIILVVYHHTYLGISKGGINISRSVSDANMIFFSFRMPLFFIISGIFAHCSLAKRSVDVLVKNKFDKILYPYFIWSFLQVSLQILLSNFVNSDRNLSHYLFILYQPRMLDQFWYLPALFNAAMIFIFLKTRLKLRTGPHIVIAFCFYLIFPFVNGISILSDWMRFYLFFLIGNLIAEIILKKQFQQYLTRPLVLALLLPIFLGSQFTYLKSNLQHNVIGVQAAELLQKSPVNYFLSELNFLTTALIGCTTLTILSFLMEKWNKLAFLRIIGYHSLYIYVAHLIVAAFIRVVLVKVFFVTNVAVLLSSCILGGVLVPIIFYNLLGKETLWFLFTPNRPKTASTRFIEPKIQTNVLFATKGLAESDTNNT